VDVEQCDLLIVGGGIHGVGVAQAGAAAGYRTVLLEQDALAAGTSSRSSKLIHGGLRYLESGHIGLVRESLRERELLLRLAPQLVRRKRIYIPIYKQTSRSPLLIRSGLTLYSILAGGRRGTGFRSVPRRDWDQLDGLSTRDLRKVYQYWDAQTDDRLLTAAVMRSAMTMDARLCCPARFLAADVGEHGCLVRYEHDGREKTIETQVLVNAAGPWANGVLALIEPRMSPLAVDMVQGSHLELPGRVEKGCYYMEVPSDRRAVFVLPWKNHTLLGTTEQTYGGDPSRVAPLPAEIDYLLDVFRHHFPARPTAVLDKWAGLRVLPRAEGTAFGRSRETQLPLDNRRQPRVVSIFGGKLTGYRATAEKVIALVSATLPARARRARTDELTLTGEGN
jgi:glycerol-3-phosphate dehydrogenase